MNLEDMIHSYVAEESFTFVAHPDPLQFIQEVEVEALFI